MEKVSQVMTALKKAGSAQTRKTYARHGAPANMFGVSVAELKAIAKQIKGQQKLAIELYDTLNADAQYLAGLVADGSQMTKSQLNKWSRTGVWQMVNEYSVPWVTSESQHCRELALKWMKSKTESIASAGWATYAAMLGVREDSELDLEEIKYLLDQIPKEIEGSKNRVRYSMNGFVISAGTYVKPLLKNAKAAAKKIGKVEVNMGETACKVPLATEYIEKVIKRGSVGKKRKTAKC